MKLTKINDNTIEVETTTSSRFDKSDLLSKKARHEQIIAEISELLAGFEE